MNNAIKERNRITLASLELARDKNFHKIHPEERMKLITQVLAIGEEIADWVASECGTRDPRKIAEIVGVKVLGGNRGRAQKSEYRKKEKEIIIFHDTLKRLTAEVTVPDLSERILRFLIAHELFHHLEETRIGAIYKRFKFPKRPWGSFYIKGLSEVAAQAFTARLLGLEFSPQVFDYLTYILFTADFKN